MTNADDRIITLMELAQEQADEKAQKHWLDTVKRMEERIAELIADRDAVYIKTREAYHKMTQIKGV